MQTIHEYYEALAPSYDASRFDTAYGRYLDRLERDLLGDWLGRTPHERVVDLACGTGRLLDFAATGVDQSAAMLAEAARKRPERAFLRADVTATGFAAGSFDAAIAFHLLMHLDEAAIRMVFAETARIVRSGGRFVFDVPSAYRRRVRPRHERGWHAGTSAALADIRSWCGDEWEVVRWRGLLAIPAHRLSAHWSRRLRPFDALIGRSPLARWSSYLVVELERR